MQSVLEILSKCEEFFASKGVPNPKLDAQLLLAKALKCKRLDLFLRFEEPIAKAALDEFREDVRRRAKREPLQHIIGNVDFAGLKLKSDARALVPRNETEEFCDILANRFLPEAGKEISILDLGTGSGAIILALKNYRPCAKCLAVETSDDALALARENMQSCALDVEFIKSDWFENVSGSFDVIVSNPPYLTDEEVASAQAEVKDYDPKSALISADKGLSDLRKIIALSPSFLKGGGILALECGIGQPSILKKENSQNPDFAEIQILQDASKRDRFIVLRAHTV